MDYILCLKVISMISPYLSYLVLGYVAERAIHVVYSIDEQDNLIVITIYEPSLDIW